ncbi:MAG: J domain-containing protein, partial [SAR324 cluster bacterium]|nr:J domain-containing protein [SAR324 cluster bacterium]
LFRLRGYWMPIFRGLSLSESEPLRHFPGKVGAAPAGGRRATAGRSVPKRGVAAFRSEVEEKERRRIVEELFRQAEELIRVSRQADITRQHTSFLLELEAELSAATQRLMERAVDLAGLRQRLEEMIAHLRKLKFSKKPLRMPEREESFYDVLKLSTDSSPAEIKTAYHQLLKEYHPDLHSSSSFSWIKEEAEMKSRRIGEAYEVLSNTQRREMYDRELRQKRGGAK